ncbi:MAG: translocation/assembly module TamB domain-containing protein [Thiobacillus sp.]|nr:translocation/assembly module TamB domain-containing protein [Thiobacillus sp.]
MKRAAWTTAAVGLGLILLVTAVFWLTSTASGFLWLAKQAVPLTQGRLILEGVEGHLGTSVRIKRLVYTSELQRITLQQVRLDWAPRSLWQRLVDIELLAAQYVRVETLKRDDTPPVYPASLRLPLEIRVAALDVAQLDFVDNGQTQEFGALHGRVDGRGDRYRLTAVATTPWARMKGQFTIAKDAPFKLQGVLTGTRADPVPVEAKAVLSGSLQAIGFRLDALAEGMSVLATGTLAPFAQVRLPQVLIAGQGIDPRQFSADAPRADLAFSGVFQGQPGERLLGTFSLTNREAGRLDQDRLPLANLTGAVVGDSANADFSALEIDLGAAGRFIGGGQWRDSQLAVNLNSPRVNLAGIHRDLYPTRIEAALQFRGDARQQTLTADVAESWGKGSFTLSLADAVLSLQDAAFSGEAGRLSAEGSLTLDATRAFEAKFDASQINPARFGKYPRARLNARGGVSGALLPAVRVQTRFTLPPGELEGRPVQGQGRLRFADGHLTDTDIDLDLAGNRALLKGAFGKPGDRMAWDVNAPALARLKLGLSGRLTSRGSISGDPRQPQIDATLAAGDLRLPGEIAADSVALTLKLRAALNGEFSGQLDARGIRVGGRRIMTAHASMTGRRDAHALSLVARLPDWQVTAALAGGLDANEIWRGQLRQAAVQGPWPAQLSGPAGLVLSRDMQQISDLSFTLAGGRVSGVQFSRRGTQMSTRGAISYLPLAPLLRLLDKPPPVTTDLRINGDWDLHLGDTLDGRLRLVREGGDVRVLDPAMNLGLTQLGLNVRAEASRVSATFEADSREAGQLRAEGSAKLEPAGAGWALPRGAPLAWKASFNVPDLRLVKPFLPLGIRLNASLAAKLTGGGSLAAPRIDGQIDADKIRFTMPEEGVSITDGTLKLQLAEDRVRVKQGELKGQGGRIVVSGEAQLKNPQAGLTLTFETFTAISRSDRQVTVSGVTQLNLDLKRLELTGELTADRARLEMPAASKPELSSDVVVIGQPPREKSARKRFPIALDLTLKLGNDFLFKGAGLDARLGGQLRVFTQNEIVRGEGVIRVEEGRYAAYAQTLTIERGVLRFVGPIDNPGLDVLAVRKTPSVKAGVQVGGTVQRPVVKLYSDPPLPDTEKLAWLVLGHGLENSGQQEFVLMQVAAAALLSKAESVNFQSKLADSLGIDSFDVRAGSGENLTSAVVSVGKRLSSRATLSYEQSLDGLSQVVKVLYQLTPTVRIEAQAGQQSSFDVFYTREYD